MRWRRISLSGVLNASGDIYSIGVVLFEMVTGRRLFDRGQTPEHLFDTVSGRTANASAVVGPLPQGLDEVIERALSVDPRMRYQSAHELTRDVQVILKSLDTVSMPFVLPSDPSVRGSRGCPARDFAPPPPEGLIEVRLSMGGTPLSTWGV